jgi:hypothetical protein
MDILSARLGFGKYNLVEHDIGHVNAGGTTTTI